MALELAGAALALAAAVAAAARQQCVPGLVTPGIDLTSTELEDRVAISARTAVDARAERRTGWNAEQGASQPRTTRRKRQLFMVAAGGDYWGDERRPRSLSRQDPNSKRVPRDI